MGTLPPIQEANLGVPDSLFLMVLALVVFGPRRLPQIGRQIGKLMYEFRKASNDFKFQMEEELRTAEEADRRKREEEERQRKLALAATATSEAPQPGLEAHGTGSGQPGPLGAGAGAEGTAPEANSTATSSNDGPYPYGMKPAARTETAADATYPRIMPPSTGQTVAAARPGDAAAGQNPPEPAPAADAGKIPPEIEPALDETDTVTEQAIPHG